MTLNLFRRSPLQHWFENQHLHLMDIGARGGMDPDLFPIAWAVDATGFEPAAEECKRLNQQTANPWRSTRYVPTAVGGVDGVSLLRIPQKGEGASLLPHNTAMLNRHGHSALHQTLKEIPVDTLTLDHACERFQLRPPDYLKIDVEGAELAILHGAKAALEYCSAAKVEVSFLEQRIGQPLMHDVLAFMHQCGFVLGEIRGLHAWRRRPLPAHPFSSQWIIPYSRGIAAQCDLVFLRNPETLDSDISLERLISIASALGFFDHAISALRQSPLLERQLNQQLDTPMVKAMGKVSKSMGQSVAITAIKEHVRNLIPLTRSFLKGIPASPAIRGGY
jgi:FkbM family methyltransferase